MDKTIKQELLKSIYLKDLRGGRSPYAHYVDLLAFILITAAVLYVPIRQRFANRTVTMLLTSVISLILLVFSVLLEKVRLDGHIVKMRQAASESAAQLKLLADYPAISQYIKSIGMYSSESVEHITADDVIKAHLANLDKIVSPGDPTDKALRLMRLFGISSMPLSDTLPKSIKDNYAPSETETDDMIISLQESNKRKAGPKLSLAALSRYSAVRYICVGIALIMLSFFAKNQLYYRLIAGAALSIGALILSFERIKALVKAKEKPSA